MGGESALPIFYVNGCPKPVPETKAELMERLFTDDNRVYDFVEDYPRYKLCIISSDEFEYLMDCEHSIPFDCIYNHPAGQSSVSNYMWSRFSPRWYRFLLGFDSELNLILLILDVDKENKDESN